MTPSETTLSHTVLENLVESSLDGIVIIRDRWFVAYANPAACRILGRARDAVVGCNFLEFIAEQHRERQYRQSTSGTPGLFDTVIVRPDGDERIITLSTEFLPAYGVDASFAVFRDVTEVRQLQAQSERRNLELAALLNASREASLTLELRPLLKRLLENLRTVVDYAATAVFALEGERMLELLAYDGPLAWGDLTKRWDLERAIHHRAVIESQLPVIIEDVSADEHLAQAFRDVARDQLGTVPEYIGTWMGVPLVVRDRVMGVLAFDHGEPGYYTPESADLAQAFAQQAAVAVENARLLERTRQSEREARALAQVASSVALAQPLEDLFEALARDVAGVTGAEACAILLRDGATASFRFVGTYGLPDGYVEADHLAGARSGEPESAETVVHQQQPLIRRGVREATLNAPEFAPLHPFVLQVDWDTIVSVPLTYQDAPLGSLSVFYRPEVNVDANRVTFLQTVADQAAVAIQNAKLMTTQQERLVLEERQRLARELHDSVSQALYGIALGARATMNALERNPANAREPLEYVLSLAEAGIAEMRALIFELRPESLAEEGLVAALTRQAAALRARYELEVEVALGDEPDVPLEVKQAFYRIAQEALHNVVKHAEASRVRLRLEAGGEMIRLEIEDDGKGFDANRAYPGHLGQQTMRERAGALGATLLIDSSPNIGTRVELRLVTGKPHPLEARE